MTPYTPQSSLLSPGRIGQARWSAALHEGSQNRTEGPPLAREEAQRIADLYHWAVRGLGLNPDLALAQACEECAYFTSDRWRRQHNPCGLGITDSDVPGHDFISAANGIQAHLEHLCCYAYRADECPAPHNPRTGLDIRHHFHDGDPRLSHLQEPKPGRRWAEKPGYVARILAICNRLLASPDAPGQAGETKMPKIALAAGHANTDGGNAFERVTTGRLTPAIARACAALGMDVRVVQQGDPCKDFAGGIWDVARHVVKWSEEGWTADIFLETHTQGVNNTAVRGVFGIYPDWGTDVDGDARDRLIPDAVRRISQATGIPVWTDGLMSEKETGVGIGGSRLGILNKTAPLAATTTRLLIEYGAHSNPADAKIHRTDAFYEQAAQATAEAFAAFLNWTPPDHRTTTPTDAGTYTVTQTAEGRTVLTIDFGGVATETLGVALADVGVTVRNAAGKKYSRSVQGGVFGEWVRHE